MKKVFRNIHLWLSVPFGLIIMLICFSGAMLVFEGEIMQLTHRSLYYVEKTDGKPLPMDKLASKVAKTLPEDVSITGITVFSDPRKSYQVNLSKPERASVYIDQYTGEIKGKYQRSPFFKTMFFLHRWLLGSRPTGDGIFWGKLIVGVSTLMFVFVLISGIVIWWPRTWKALKNSLKITARKGTARFWYGLHVAGGMYALLLVLVMALTGLTWSFGWYRTAFYSVFGVDAPSYIKHGHATVNIEKGKKENGWKGGKEHDWKGGKEHDWKGGKEHDRKGGKEHDWKGGKEHDWKGGKEHDRKGDALHSNSLSFVYWQQVYEELAKENPGCKQISVSDGSASVSSNFFGNIRGEDSYAFDSHTGKITSVSRYAEMDNSSKIRGWIYSVHVGSWGGMLTRILWFLAALLGASLPLTGYYLWIKRIYRKKHS